MNRRLFLKAVTATVAGASVPFTIGMSKGDTQSATCGYKYKYGAHASFNGLMSSKEEVAALNAMTRIMVKEMQALVPIADWGKTEWVFKHAGSPDKSDPLGQRGHVAWTYATNKELDIDPAYSIKQKAVCFQV